LKKPITKRAGGMAQAGGCLLNKPGVKDPAPHPEKKYSTNKSRIQRCQVAWHLTIRYK
jgi:hypothetical protein